MSLHTERYKKVYFVQVKLDLKARYMWTYDGKMTVIGHQQKFVKLQLAVIVPL